MTAFDRLKKLCDDKGLSVNKLEEKLDLGKNTLYSWKKNIPKGTNLLRVAEFFNVSTDYLLGRTAFRKPMELFEHWGKYSNDPYFEPAFDFGKLLKEVRIENGITETEVSNALGITLNDLVDIEDGVLPINYEWAERFAKCLNTSVNEIFYENTLQDSLNEIPLELLNQFQEQGLSDSEMIEAYKDFRNAEQNDAIQEKPDSIAAHHIGEDWTEDELEEIEQFKEFVKSKRKDHPKKG